MESHEQWQWSCKIATQAALDNVARRYEGWKWLQRYKEVPSEASLLEIKLYQEVFCVN